MEKETKTIFPPHVEGLSVAEDRILELVGHLGTAEATISRLTAEQATLQNTIDVLESNARVQAKLLADTGRERDGLRKALTLIGDAPCSMVNDSESLRHTIKTIQQIARQALATPAVSDAQSRGGANG